MKTNRQIYIEQFQYALIAFPVGILIGCIDALFGRILLWIGDFRNSHLLYLLPFLALAGLFILFLYWKFSKESLKGMTLIFQTGHGEAEHIPLLLVPLVIVSTWITHLFGGSAGREGVAVQLGGAIAHTLGKKLNRLNQPRMFLVIGMAAGFGGLFQTPIAATFFAMEVLISGVILYETLFPSLIAAFTASYTAHLCGLEKFSISIPFFQPSSNLQILKMLLCCVLFGIVGGLFAYLLKNAKSFLAKKINSPYLRIAIVGLILSILFLLLHFGRYSGLGTNLISMGFGKQTIYSYDWVLKMLLTILTLSAGYQGGEVTPLFAIGTALGVTLASLLGLPVMLIAACGYIAVFGGATNTLFAPIIIGIELFGGANAFWFILACCIAYVFNGCQSIYGNQKRHRIFHHSNS